MKNVVNNLVSLLKEDVVKLGSISLTAILIFSSLIIKQLTADIFL